MNVLEVSGVLFTEVEIPCTLFLGTEILFFFSHIF